jgi:uncharacterized membrane protein
MAAHPLLAKILHRSYQIGILVKGIDGLLETIGGFLFLFVSQRALAGFVDWLTGSELLEDPDDWVANSLRNAFDHLSTNNQAFVAAYLLAHGVIKLLLVGGLWWGRRWVFPVAGIVLLAFIGYQAYRLTHHFSLGLCLFTLMDTVVFTLIWREYRLKGGRRSHR